jgi:hypothetical protein
MNVELVAQMFKNYQSNVLFHLEGICFYTVFIHTYTKSNDSNGELERAIVKPGDAARELAARSIDGTHNTHDTRLALESVNDEYN